jgi:diacylglycerol kinase
MWEGAQRAAFRTLVLAVGCVLVISGAATLDATAGGVAIVASFAVLLVEALR